MRAGLGSLRRVGLLIQIWSNRTIDHQFIGGTVKPFHPHSRLWDRLFWPRISLPPR